MVTIDKGTNKSLTKLGLNEDHSEDTQSFAAESAFLLRIPKSSTSNVNQSRYKILKSGQYALTRI